MRILIAVLFVIFSSISLKAEKKMNFIFILVDDLGWNNLGCFGSPFFETPYLDQLSKSSMKFTQAYAAHPVCSPTRAAIMSGKNPARIKITDWIPGMGDKKGKLNTPKILKHLPQEEVTIAEALKNKGYKTFYAGKWHLGGHEGYLPTDQGFDTNYGGGHYGGPPGGYYAPWKNEHMPTKGKDGEYLTDHLTDRSIEFMKENKDNPFFLYLSYYNIHTPIQPCKRHMDYFKSKKNIPAKKLVKEHNAMSRVSQDNLELASMIYAMDENVGRLVKKVKELGLDENTVIIFTSDNGGLATKSKGGPNSVYPLRGSKGWCYEGGIRIPTMIKVPGLTDKGAENDFPVVSMDFYPTILELAGMELMPKQHVDGISMVPLLKGKKSLDRQDILFHYPHYHGSTWTPGSAIRSGDWKLIEFYDFNKVELYNLKEDQGEQNNLAKKYPEKTKELLKRLKAIQKDNGAELPTPK